MKPSEIQVLKAEFFDLEKQFAENLARIYNKGAIKSGVQGCHTMIDQNSGNPEVVGIFLKTLCNKNLIAISKSASSGGFQFLQFHACLFGYMALKFGTRLKDSIRDIPPSLNKTVKRMLTSMKTLFFQESHDNIRNACAISYSEILDKCFVGKRYGAQNKLARDLVYEPLYDELIPGRDRASR